MHAYSVRFQPEATQLGNLEIEKRPILIKKETGTASSVPRLESVGDVFTHNRRYQDQEVWTLMNIIWSR